MKKEILDFGDQFSRIESDCFHVINKGFAPKKISNNECRPLEAEPDIVLIIGASPGVSQSLKTALEKDYQVIEANDGLTGIQKTIKFLPDIVLSGIMTPLVNGLQICKILKNDIRTGYIPLVFLTARASDEQLTLCYESGADDYIPWPYNLSVLRARIKNLIRVGKHLNGNLSQRHRFPLMENGHDGIGDNNENSRAFLQKLNAILEKNISDPLFCVSDLCKKMIMSRTSFYRRVIALTGKSPQLFIRSFRLSRAAELLKKNRGNVTEVAFKVGFTSAAYFTKCFKEMFNRLPSTFR